MSVRAEVETNTWDRPDIGALVRPIAEQGRNLLPFALIFLLVGGAVFFAISCKGSTVAFSNDSQVATLSVEVVDTPASRARGLMERESLGRDSGMLFDFGSETTSSFYMKDTSIPLSIAFIDAGGVVLDIRDMQPFDLTPVSPPGAYRWAIEVNQGWFEQQGIRPGHRVTINV